jgi:hypothetical protein
MGGGVSQPWGRAVRLADLAHGPLRLALEPDVAERAEIARAVGLEGLPELRADLELRPWLDGAELRGRFEARVIQICGVSLDPFEQPVRGEIDLRLVPSGSPNAPDDTGGEVALDLEAPDPPDVLDGEAFDPSHYVVEHLALALDPFPRKPGAAFEFKPAQPDDSPFAALKRLKEDDH